MYWDLKLIFKGERSHWFFHCWILLNEVIGLYFKLEYLSWRLWWFLPRLHYVTFSTIQNTTLLSYASVTIWITFLVFWWNIQYVGDIPTINLLYLNNSTWVTQVFNVVMNLAISTSLCNGNFKSNSLVEKDAAFFSSGQWALFYFAFCLSSGNICLQTGELQCYP